MDNVKDLLGHLLHCTVQIYCENTNGTASTGTGFVFGFEKNQGTFLTVITNRHVLKKAKEIRITLTRLKGKGKPDIGKHKTIIFQDASEYWHGHPDNDVDLALLPLSQALNASKKEGNEFFFTILSPEFIAKDELLESLSAFEDIVMIGYPNSLWDKINNLPIIRKGITATHPIIKYNGRPEFVIDAACFNGSSGSPVFLANIGNYIDKNGEIAFGSRVALLGILWGGPLFSVEGEIIDTEISTEETKTVISQTTMNLGYVIHASEILGFEKVVDNISENYYKTVSGIVESVEIDKNDPTRMRRNDPCDCGSGKKFRHCCGALK
ncbi:trypsin-like peptidase domain-containing protein [Providencia rettgeri]|nr:trypsin-like peptidase domain-containing protein [Providencia rettgeri]